MSKTIKIIPVTFSWQVPAHKEPQYLYVYLDDDYEFSTIKLANQWKYIGKIKLEDTENE